MKIGLALSGGAARGIAHIGVLKYLEEQNVKPCCIAGTSAGSIVGAMYCSGKTINELEDAARNISWKELVKFSVPKQGLIKSSRLLNVLKGYIGAIDFSDLEIPLLVNAVDLLQGEEVILKKGPVAEAVHASCAIPGIFTPVKLGDYLLVDGGLLDNVPVTVMDKFDLDYIIAVDVGAQKPLQKEPNNIFEVLMQSFDIIRRQRDIPAHENADLIIEPDLEDIMLWDVGKAQEIIERGYQAAREALKDINLKKKQGKISKWFNKRKK